MFPWEEARGGAPVGLFGNVQSRGHRSPAYSREKWPLAGYLLSYWIFASLVQAAFGSPESASHFSRATA